MKAIVIGTKNPAKIDQLRSALKQFGINVAGMDSGKEIPEVDEDGKTPLDNARKKALVYAKFIGGPVLSFDSALYFEGLVDEFQPAMHVRRIHGSSGRPSDEELREYFQKLISSLGKKINAFWETGVCIATADGKTWETVIKTPRLFGSKPSKKQIEGYPLESFQLDPETGKYISEMTPKEKDAFWQKTIGAQLAEFINSIPL